MLDQDLKILRLTKREEGMLVW